MTAESLTNLIENTVINNCKKRDSKDTINKNKEGTTYKSKNKIPRNVRLWMRRKNLASKALLKVKTVKGCKRLKEKIKEAEAALARDSFKRKIEI